MTTAIISSSLSALACGLALEQRGCPFTIWERRHIYGERYRIASVLLQGTGQKDWLSIVEHETGIKLQPAGKIKRIVAITPQKEAVYEGDLGWIMLHGEGKESVSGSFASQLKTKITYNFPIDFPYACQTHDHVVISGPAGGLSAASGLWKPQQMVYICGAFMLGSYGEPDTVYIKSGFEYCPDGVAYLIPLPNKRLFVALCLANRTRDDLATHWDAFIKFEKIRLEIIETVELLHQAGHMIKMHDKGVWYAEEGCGFFDPIFGWSAAASILKGFQTGLAIAGKQQVEPPAWYEPNPILSPLELLQQSLGPARETAGIGGGI